MVDLDVRGAAGHPPWRTQWSSLVTRAAAAPLLAQVGVIYLLSRVVSTVIFLEVAAQASPDAQLGQGADLLTQAVGWDGGWYQRIAADGYPSTLPTVAGQVQPNAWAFMPLYPFLVKVLAFGNADLWPAAAVCVSVVCGACAAGLLAVLVHRHGTKWQSLTAVTIFVLGPTGYILQTAYAESMGLALLFLLLLLVDLRRYMSAGLVAVPLALTRPGMQALALFMALHLIGRIVAHRRGTDRLSPAEVTKIVSLGVAVGLLGFVWLVVAAWVTGRPDAYLATEISWRVPFTGSADLGAFRPWLVAFRSWFGITGKLVFAAVLLITLTMLVSARLRALGSTIVLFGAAWIVYLLAVFFPQSSTFRLLMPLAPLGGALPIRTLRGLALVGAVCVLLQGFWLFHGYGAPVTQWSAP